MPGEWTRELLRCHSEMWWWKPFPSSQHPHVAQRIFQSNVSGLENYINHTTQYLQALICSDFATECKTIIVKCTRGPAVVSLRATVQVQRPFAIRMRQPNVNVTHWCSWTLSSWMRLADMLTPLLSAISLRRNASMLVSMICKDTSALSESLSCLKISALTRKPWQVSLMEFPLDVAKVLFGPPSTIYDKTDKALSRLSIENFAQKCGA